MADITAGIASGETVRAGTNAPKVAPKESNSAGTTNAETVTGGTCPAPVEPKDNGANKADGKGAKDEAIGTVKNVAGVRILNLVPGYPSPSMLVVAAPEIHDLHAGLLAADAERKRINGWIMLTNVIEIMSGFEQALTSGTLQLNMLPVAHYVFRPGVDCELTQIAGVNEIEFVPQIISMMQTATGLNVEFVNDAFVLSESAVDWGNEGEEDICDDNICNERTGVVLWIISMVALISAVISFVI